MSDKVYIRSTGLVSPLGGEAPTGAGHRAISEAGQQAADGTGSQQNGAPADRRLRAIEPDYARYIDPRAIRRMSRVIRMGVAAALQCLEGAGLWQPAGAAVAGGEPIAAPTAPGAALDAIITGTAYGCLEDTTVFLRRMVENREEMLTPTAFIQSTHNTVGAQIALMLQCHAYNNTFVHRGFSFEHALLDGAMLLKEGAAQRVLVGGVDEITDTSHSILSRFGLYKKDRINGEGATFFLLDKSENSGICLEGMDTFYRPEDPAKHIQAFLEMHPDTFDVVLGDPIPGGVATEAEPFRHTCGDYPTASAFGLWLATEKVKAGANRVLVYNNYLDIHHSLFLVSSC
jgi:hypothetical protein